jgi:hypothetical protein
MDTFRWKGIKMRNKMWDMDLIHLIQDRAIGMFLHDHSNEPSCYKKGEGFMAAWS